MIKHPTKTEIALTCKHKVRQGNHILDILSLEKLAKTMMNDSHTSTQTRIQQKKF